MGAGRRFGLLLALLAGGAAAAEPVTRADLARAYAASRAMADGDAAADAYRAGRFDGYLTGLAEALAARREICLPACFCAVREALAPALERGPAAADAAQAAGPWLAAQLAQNFPCPGR